MLATEALADLELLIRSRYGLIHIDSVEEERAAMLLRHLSDRLGLPLILVSAQMAYGGERAWLPQFIMNRSISAEQFRKVMDWSMPRLIRIERVIRPRYWPFWHRQGEIIIGSLTLLLAIIITLPIPLGNWPPALAIAFISLALSERDGVMLAIGVFLSVAAVAIITLLAASATMFVNYLWHHFFSIID